ncbi:hypothetical protein N7509_006352 [Penicillium cosmopolitanum]|uniref:Uncharacterized protein n=1 Tax=Penicillium cosmopolitanum TaxID=1131564 RepID=A0A9X0BB01_9EURO|nr:uncharacterized protein N7509_006352 [Penicillium cosmopolitanum]KAJ5398239.1 hypothetical protein N7509_006352 [Penicillium cosmopolitanum]
MPRVDPGPVRIRADSNPNGPMPMPMSILRELARLENIVAFAQVVHMNWKDQDNTRPDQTFQISTTPSHGQRQESIRCDSRGHLGVFGQWKGATAITWGGNRRQTGSINI